MCEIIIIDPSSSEYYYFGHMTQFKNIYINNHNGFCMDSAASWSCCMLSQTPHPQGQHITCCYMYLMHNNNKVTTLRSQQRSHNSMPTNLIAEKLKIIPEQSLGITCLVGVSNACKSADLADIQPVIPPGCCKSWPLGASCLLLQ